jgi:predicted small metal-binding protein
MTVGPQSWILVGGVGAKVTPTLSQEHRRTTVEEDEMVRIIRCECGYVARGDTDDEVIDAIRAHMKTDHPALLETVGQEDLLAWIQVE